MSPKRPPAEAPVEPAQKRTPGKVLASIQDLAPAEPLAHAQAVAVMDKLKALDKAGNPGPLRQYRELKTHKEKREFAISLSLDPSASFAKAVETRSIASTNRKRQVSGEFALWEIAKLEGLEYNDANKVILEGLVEGCPSRPHPKPALARAGFLIYDYNKKMGSEKLSDDKHTMALQKEPTLSNISCG